MHKILTDGFSALGLELTDEMLTRYATYGQYLEERNKVMNLTTISGDEDVARLHFLDCVALLSIHDFSGKSVIDVGSGAGFPGLPLKIAKPDIRLTLLDSHKKRVDFLEEVCQKIEMPQVRCIWARAEEVTMGIGGSFDIAVSRAVARLNVLCELCLPFVNVGGVFIAMKGLHCENELEEAQHAIAVLGGGKAEIKTYKLPDTDISRSAIIIKKIKHTPNQYPRQYGRIKKAPL